MINGSVRNVGSAVGGPEPGQCMAGYGGKNDGERTTNRALRRVVQTNTSTAVFAFPRGGRRQRLRMGMGHRQHTAPGELEQQQETGYWAHGSRYNPLPSGRFLRGAQTPPRPRDDINESAPVSVYCKIIQ